VLLQAESEGAFATGDSPDFAGLRKVRGQVRLARRLGLVEA
jgi:hypothetical protein